LWANFYNKQYQTVLIKMSKIPLRVLKFKHSINTVLPLKIRGGKATRLKYKEAHEHEEVSNM